MRIPLLPAVLALLPLALAVPASAAPPVPDEGSDSGFVFVFDCGDFEIWDAYESHWSGKSFLDDEGNPVALVLHVWGSDTFVNTTSGESVTGTINSGEKVDLVAETANQNGTIGRITVPGVGLVFIDVGRYVIEFGSEEPVFLQGQHDFFTGDFDALCEVLA
jgi:hypothetical protein